ncbi:MAG: sigma-70 family RNA polymerase sigma factor [Lachnospiraceae bacterium]|nr:sigma-70 family RNA polymerase sigma factor [Lachnospiraceae bacterium]
MQVTEDNYVELMKQGNEKALQYFIEHDGWIVKSIVCHKLKGHETEQEECINDVFLAIWQNVSHYDSNRAAFTTWVSAVTRYRILNYRRKLQNAEWEDIDKLQLVAGGDDWDQFLMDEEEEFLSLLQGLSEEDKEIFVRLFWDEQDYNEISQEMNIPKDRLYNRISRGKKKLRNTIGIRRRGMA